MNHRFSSLVESAGIIYSISVLISSSGKKGSPCLIHIVDVDDLYI